MKTLSTFVFGAVALLFATFATATPAAASDAGFGFSIQIGHDPYDDYYDNRRCWSYWYRRHHPYRCNGYWPHRGYYHRSYWRHRRYDDYWYWHQRQWPYCRDRRPYHDHDRW